MTRYAFLTILLTTVSAPALAQDGGEAEPPADIVVTADRFIIEALRRIRPEREYGETDVGDRGLSTVGEFVDEVRAENGDEEVVFLINGEPVSGIDDVADFPAEAVERLEVLPRGSGQRIGRQGDRRVYNVVLKDQLRSPTLTASRKLATEGDWGENAGEAILTRIAGRERVNLTLRARDSDPLLESDRGILQPAPGTATRLADFYEPVDAGTFRTLRGASRSYEASLIGGTPIAGWLTSSFSIVGRIGRDASLSGLPYNIFLLPGSSPFSADGVDRTLLLYGSDPLGNRSNRRSLNANGTLNATRGDWTATLTGQVTLARREFENERLIQFNPLITVPDERNPFADPLDDFFLASAAISRSTDRSASVRLNVGGPVVRLPAGSLRVRSAVERNRDRSRIEEHDQSTSTTRTFLRSATQMEAGVDIPLASRREGFLSALGELSLSLDRGLYDVDRFGSLDSSSAVLLWQPDQRLSVTATASRNEELPSLDLLTDPVVVYDNVRVFDFLTGETADVIAVTGGNPALLPLRKSTRRLSISGAAWPRYSLQINLDYEEATLRDFVAGVPAASSAVLTAFPERFEREGGRLVLVDSRPVNFDRQDRREVRYGFSFLLPIGRAEAPLGGDGKAAVASFRPAAANSPARLQVTASHSIALEDEIVIRPTLPVVDLLSGGAIGIGGGRPRHLINASASLSGKGYGLRVASLYRSASSTFSGTAAQQDTLRFEPIFTANVRAFIDFEPLLPQATWTKGARLSLAIENIADRRQRVIDSSGLTPLRYQGAYRDPVGRTFEIELRKVF